MVLPLSRKFVALVVFELAGQRFAETLRASGYQVRLAAALGESAAMEDRADLIILDAHQSAAPDPGGRRGAPVLRLGSGAAQDSPAEGMARELNADELVAKVRELLDARKAS